MPERPVTIPEDEAWTRERALAERAVLTGWCAAASRSARSSTWAESTASCEATRCARGCGGEAPACRSGRRQGVVIGIREDTPAWSCRCGGQPIPDAPKERGATGTAARRPRDRCIGVPLGKKSRKVRREHVPERAGGGEASFAGGHSCSGLESDHRGPYCSRSWGTWGRRDQGGTTGERRRDSTWDRRSQTGGRVLLLRQSTSEALRST